MGDEDRYYHHQRGSSSKFPKFDQRQNEISSKGGNSPRVKDFYGDNFNAGSSVYGGSYGYESNFHPGEDQRHLPPAGTGRDHETGPFYGTSYGYGGAYGYGNGDNYIPREQDQGEVPYLPGNRMECSFRFAAGFRLARGTIRKAFLTSNLDQCESLCINEKDFLCVSFTYRYTVASTDPTDNCLLSELSFKDLNFYTDLEPDRNYDIYELNGDVKACMEKPNNEKPPDECFWRVKSGFGIPPEIVRKSVTVDNLGECQIECTTIQDFTCRSFAFRFGTRNDGNNYQFSNNNNNNNNNDDNCFLTDYPSREINPATLPDLDGAELYERGSFGRGCERYPFPLYEPGRFPNSGSNDVDNKHLSFGGGTAEGGDVCYNEHHKPCRLAPVAILLSIRVETEADCRRKCNHMRERDPVPCMSYSYRLGDPDRGSDENCLLSDVPQRDLRPGYDYVNDDRHVLVSWKELDQHCLSFENDFPSGKPDVPYFPESPVHPLGGNYGTPFYGGIKQETYDGIKPIYGSISPTRGRGRGFQFRPSGHNGIRPYDPDRPDPPTSAQPGGEKFFSFGLNHPFGPNNEWTTFQRYTVNGYPCKRGTRCERNKVAGFWSCETEGGELGAWDYCCEPNHRCGYSQGYNYPWCYVGHSKDQWRPCSNEYFPYLPSPRPKGTESRDSSHGRRHWPVAYLHREPPPVSSNSDLVISGNDRRERNFVKGGKRSSKSSRSRIGRRQVVRLQEPESAISRNLTHVPESLGNSRKSSNVSSIDPQIYYTTKVSVSFPRVENRKEEKSDGRKAVIERVSRPIFSSRTRGEINGTNIGSDIPWNVRLKEIELIPSPSNSSSVP